MGSNGSFTLPGHSRVWIYQSSRFLQPEEIKHIEKKAEEFLASWNSHGMDLLAEIKVMDNLFVVLAADEMKAKASGCSIDKSVRLIKSLEEELNISLTGRTTIAYIDTNNTIQLKNFQDLRSAIDKGELTPETKIFNNLVSTLSDFERSRILPANESWLMQIPA